MVFRQLERYQQGLFTGAVHVAAYIVDVARMRYLNDEMGHEAGDRLLIAVADALSSLFQGSAVLRPTGDGFAVLDPRPPITAAPVLTLGSDLSRLLEPVLASGTHLRLSSLDLTIVAPYDHRVAGAVLAAELRASLDVLPATQAPRRRVVVLDQAVSAS